MRRPLAALLAALAVVAPLPGCATGGTAATIRILGPWTGDEEKTFLEVLAPVLAREGIEVSYVGTRAYGQVLQSEVQQGTPPHIAILPSPGEVATYARRQVLRPLGPLLGERPDPEGRWALWERVGTPERYAVTLTTKVKGLVWFPADTLPPGPPEDVLARAAGTHPTPWCMGVASLPDAGWPGTDWVEDLLLRQAGPEVYRKWSAGSSDPAAAWTSDAVRRAWLTWGELAAKSPGGPATALMEDVGAAGRPMFDRPPGCLLDHQASSPRPGYPADRPVDFIELPPVPAVEPAREVAADFAVLFDDAPAARAVLAHLASAQAQRAWLERGGFPVDRGVPLPPGADAATRRVAGILADDGALCFDASDLMPVTMRTAFHEAVLTYLADPGRLEDLLGQLERLRARLPREEWLDLPCGSGP